MNSVVQLGAGRAGAAVAHAILILVARKLSIFDLNTQRAQTLAVALCTRFGADRATAGSDLTGAMAAADGLINATPTGMVKYP